QALEISSQEFDLMTDAMSLRDRLLLSASEVVVDKSATLSRDSVSRLYRVVSFARALKLSISDFLILRAHTTIVPLAGDVAAATPQTTEAFCKLVSDFRTLKIGVDDVSYVLRAFAPDALGLAPKEADVDALRHEITTTVDLIISETETIEDV